MDSDVDVSRWVLELLLRDREKESVAKRVIAAAPLSNHDRRLKKTLLLHTIESQIFDEAAVTETILESLESIEALDRGQGIPVTDAMRAAYCAVATELTVKFLVCFEGKPGGKYMEAVDRVWRGRVRVLEEAEGCELVSAELKERRDEVEAGVWDMRVSKRLGSLNSRNDALRSVAAYVKEALAMLGPPFAAWAVRFCMEKGSLSSPGEKVVVESDGNVGDGDEMEVEMVNVVDLDVPMANGVDSGDGSEHNPVSEQEVQRPDGANVQCGSQLEEQGLDGANDGGADRSELEAQKANGAEVRNASEPPNGNRGVLRCEPTSKVKETPRVSAVRHRHGPAKIRDDEDVVTELSAGKYNSVTSAEVRRVQEELKASVSALHGVVTDQLSYALRIAEVVCSELGSVVSGEHERAANPSVEENAPPDQSNNDNHANQSSHQNDVPQCNGKENDAPTDKGKDTENAQMGGVDHGNPSSSYQNVHRASLMERNSTARTYEWDDSLGMSPEQTYGKGRLHIPSPKRITVSPLKKYEDKRISKRRKIRRWSLEEEETLRTGVQKYGRGNWKVILDAYRAVFEERTEVDLKDKWRNLTK
ncbi:uncharacterized protein LOC126786524 [Argentina anserina]|uniref:uncharacterized protein LOC126786524 n=1 Tax=Argentina anserina TaxID=57926 RepID=UPI0021763873|nr:uncharacterized protein LOC126786524 [Potentilla anserina]